MLYYIKKAYTLYIYGKCRYKPNLSSSKKSVRKFGTVITWYEEIMT